VSDIKMGFFSEAAYLMHVAVGYDTAEKMELPL
jgi:hypothetical protein